MAVRVAKYSSLKTGILVMRHRGGSLPRIGDLLEEPRKNLKLRVLDVIGPIQEPFIVVKPIRGEVGDEVYEMKYAIQRPKGKGVGKKGRRGGKK